MLLNESKAFKLINLLNKSIKNPKNYIFLIFFVMISSCTKDELIINKKITPPKQLEILNNQSVQTERKKPKFKIFRKKKCKVVKSY